METTTIPSTSTAALVALRSDNYVDWSAKMKNYLLAQGLWDIVEPSSMETSKPAYVEFEAWKKNNDAALHAIQSTCGLDILFLIYKISSAKIAWEKLAEIFNPTRTGTKDQIIQKVGQQESSSNNPGMISKYAALVKAVRSGDWNATREFLSLHPDALTARINTHYGKTVLHVAVAAQQEHIVQELVNMMSEHDLAIPDDNGITALTETIFRGNYQIAECLIRKNRNLVTIRSSTLKYDLPVVMAMYYGHKELARYLYHQTPLGYLESELGSLLLGYAIYARELDIALHLMERCPRLALGFDTKYISSCPLYALANVITNDIPSSTSLQGWLYRHLRGRMHHQLVSSLLNLMGFERDLHHETMLVHHDVQFRQLLSRMCEAIATADITPEMINFNFVPAIFSAISKGNFEFVFHVVKANPDLLWIRNNFQIGIFQYAVNCRQPEIFSLIYGLRDENNALTRYQDVQGNNILHMAGVLTEITPIDLHIAGAALQMQKEVQWFKEVERICPPLIKGQINKEGLSPREFFTKSHQGLRKEGERWMKETATSCSTY
ncbi:hypothetical protein F2P56_037180 [Juglans regia]|uniref:DUF4219 domain-containing protein n=1 Tax=Juglans regia TaxID=51240 RepID=A0A833WB66_JUGRE|nr:hypothetical protein F2P56_037180 [Juglans regia]